MRKLFFALFLSGVAITGMAQQPAGYIGSWEGTLSVGVDLRIIFHIKSDGHGKLVSTADSPDQAAFGIP